MEQPELAGIAALYAVIELVKFFISKARNSTGGLTAEQAAQLENLHRLHNQYDESGRLKWHVPVSLVTQSDATLAMVVELKTQIARAIDLLKRIDGHTEP